MTMLAIRRRPHNRLAALTSGPAIPDRRAQLPGTVDHDVPCFDARPRTKVGALGADLRSR